MKILMVSHNYLPAHAAGTEVYVARLAAGLVDRGHQVSVFTTQKDIAQPDLSVREREHDGVPVVELINNLYYSSFRETWDHPRIAALFGAALDRLQPELVHFHHLLYLSLGCVEEAARRGLGVVFTLHDYWLHCPRFGQRVHADGSLCPTVDFDRCGSCLASFKYSQTALERATGRAIAGVRGMTGIDLSRAAKGAARALPRGSRGSPAEGPVEVDPAVAAARARDVALRDQAVRERVLPHVDRFVAPSRFLRERFAEWGLAAERVEHVPTGIDAEEFSSRERAEREPGAPLRVVFIGSLVPLKGPHLLLEAWGRLPAELRARARLELYGPGLHHPAYQDHLRALAAEHGAELRGPLARPEVPGVLAAADLLVVPSTWYENAPLIILEARSMGTPLLVSDAGGMGELVDEEAGLRFRLGDAADLARRLGEVLEDPTRLAGLGGGAPVPSLEQTISLVERLYAEVLEA